MKHIYKFGIVTLAMLTAFSCEDEDAAPIVTYDSATKGAYVRLVEQSASLMNIQDQTVFDASSYVYSVDFVDETLGA